MTGSATARERGAGSRAAWVEWYPLSLIPLPSVALRAHLVRKETLVRVGTPSLVANEPTCASGLVSVVLVHVLAAVVVIGGLCVNPAVAIRTEESILAVTPPSHVAWAASSCVYVVCSMKLCCSGADRKALLERGVTCGGTVRDTGPWYESIVPLPLFLNFWFHKTTKILVVMFETPCFLRIVIFAFDHENSRT